MEPSYLELFKKRIEDWTDNEKTEVLRYIVGQYNRNSTERLSKSTSFESKAGEEIIIREVYNTLQIFESENLCGLMDKGIVSKFIEKVMLDSDIDLHFTIQKERKYRAHLRDNTTNYSVSFRHPLVLGPDGQYGRRIHKGLGTDRGKAEKIVKRLNSILSSKNLNLTDIFRQAEEGDEASLIFISNLNKSADATGLPIGDRI